MIKNAKIVSTDTDPVVYHKTTGGGRGDPDHIMSSSQLRAFSESPSKWLAGANLPDDEDTESTFWGSLMDCLVTQPEAFEKRYAVTPETYPDAKTGEPKAWNWNANVCKEWRDKQGDKEVIKPDKEEQANEALTRLRNDTRLAEFIDASKTQVFVMGEWHDESGVVIPIKGLIDFVPAVTHPLFGKCLGDLKTGRCGAPGAWKKVCFSRGYHIQAALYLDLYCAATGEDRCDFRHVVQESMPPYEPGRRYMSAEMLTLGRSSPNEGGYADILRRYCACVAANQWPGWDDGPSLIEGWSAVEPELWMISKP
jgi:hypothetical protein